MHLDYIEKIERDYLLELMPKKGRCAEIGVWKGDFSQQIIDITNPSRLFLIDPWSFYNDYEHKKGIDGQNQIDMETAYVYTLNRFKDNKNVMVVRQSSDIASKYIKDNDLDWVYIDGNHMYEYVYRDLIMYFNKVKLGGYITGDDYLSTGYKKIPLRRAVDKFIQEYDDRIEVVHLGKERQYIFRKVGL